MFEIVGPLDGIDVVDLDLYILINTHLHPTFAVFV